MKKSPFSLPHWLTWDFLLPNNGTLFNFDLGIISASTASKMALKELRRVQPDRFYIVWVHHQRRRRSDWALWCCSSRSQSKGSKKDSTAQSAHEIPSERPLGSPLLVTRNQWDTDVHVQVRCMYSFGTLGSAWQIFVTSWRPPAQCSIPYRRWKERIK